MKECKLTIRRVDVTNKDSLCDIYELLEVYNKLDVLMYDDNSLQTFIEKFSKSWLYILVLEDEQGLDIVGMTAFDSFLGKSAFFHFCLWGGSEPYAVDFAKLVFDTVFSKDDLFTVFGLTPCVYRHVFPSMRKLGFEELKTVKKVCNVRGKLRDAVVSCITKEQFYKVNEV